MINELKLLKYLNEENEFGFLSSQSLLIESSLRFLKEEFRSNNTNLHPNKQFHMLQLFDTIDETKMTLETDWEANYDEISFNMEKLQEMLSSNIQKKYFYQNIRLMKFIGDDEINISYESNDVFFFKDFKTNPIELLKESDDI